MSNLIRLRRHDTGSPWGFRLNGGADMGQPLYIQKVTINSIAHRVGLRPGDAVLQIGSTPSAGMGHSQAKMEILRAGNELDFIVQRGAVPIQGGPAESQLIQHEPRAQVVEEHAGWKGASQNPNVQSRSFKILQEQLGSE